MYYTLKTQQKARGIRARAGPVLDTNTRLYMDDGDIPGHLIYNLEGRLPNLELDAILIFQNI